MRRAGQACRQKTICCRTPERVRSSTWVSRSGSSRCDDRDDTERLLTGQQLRGAVGAEERLAAEPPTLAGKSRRMSIARHLVNRFRSVFPSSFRTPAQPLHGMTSTSAARVSMAPRAGAATFVATRATRGLPPRSRRRRSADMARAERTTVSDGRAGFVRATSASQSRHHQSAEGRVP